MDESTKKQKYKEIDRLLRRANSLLDAVYTLHTSETRSMSRDAQSSYYDVGGIETLDIIKAKLPPEQYKGYLLGNVIKYSSRCNHKGKLVRDAEKLANYSEWHVEAVKEQENDKESTTTPLEVHDGTFNK